MNLLVKKSSLFTIINYLNSDLIENYEKVYLPLDVIRISQLHGMSLEEEENFRLYGCELIQEGGIMLKLPQITMTTAMFIFHRFFFNVSFLQVDLKTVATASLFLATKLEETPKKIRDIVSVFDYLLKMKDNVQKPIPVIDLGSVRFSDVKQKIISEERRILKELGFIFQHIKTNPYKYLYHYTKVLKTKKSLAQKAWNFINDTYRTTIPIHFQPHKIACLGIYMASAYLNHPFPDTEWYKVFDTELEEINTMAGELLFLYNKKKISSQYITAVMNKYMDRIHLNQPDEELGEQQMGDVGVNTLENGEGKENDKKVTGEKEEKEKEALEESKKEEEESSGDSSSSDSESSSSESPTNSEKERVRKQKEREKEKEKDRQSRRSVERRRSRYSRERESRKRREEERRRREDERHRRHHSNQRHRSRRSYTPKHKHSHNRSTHRHSNSHRQNNQQPILKDSHTEKEKESKDIETKKEEQKSEPIDEDMHFIDRLGTEKTDNYLEYINLKKNK